MNPQHFYTLLYDMALATSGETLVRPLITKALQRLLYHTGFPCGIYIHADQEELNGDSKYVNSQFEVLICHDKNLPKQGADVKVEREVIQGQIELINKENIFGTSLPYHTILRVPVGGDGCFILLSEKQPGHELPYRQLFEPIMGNFSKNLQLCRKNEANTYSLKNEIEQHKFTLASLRESELNHKEAQRLGKIGHWLLEMATGELSWSDEIYRIFDRNKEEFKPGLDNFYDMVHPDDVDAVKQAVAAACKNNFYTIEHRIVLPDESSRWVHERAKIIKNNTGEVTQMVGTVQDITEQKQAEEEKDLLMRQLQQAQKMESIGHLTGGIAHDFNNILAAMLGFAELLEELITDSADKEKMLSYLHEIIIGGERARDLVAQMLAFSRGKTGNVKNINPIPVIEEAIKLLSAMIPSTVSIETQIENINPDTVLLIDPVQLHQVIMNLVINARDAMEGKGVILLGLRPARRNNICNSCHEHFAGNYLELYIADTGEGIKSEVLSRIFDPFYTSKEMGKGTGMGLSVVHGIVHASNGHIQIETSSEKGTTISLFFPIVNEDVKSKVSGRVGLKNETNQNTI